MGIDYSIYGGRTNVAFGTELQGCDSTLDKLLQCEKEYLVRLKQMKGTFCIGMIPRGYKHLKSDESFQNNLPEFKAVIAQLMAMNVEDKSLKITRLISELLFSLNDVDMKIMPSNLQLEIKHIQTDSSLKTILAKEGLGLLPKMNQKV